MNAWRDALISLNRRQRVLYFKHTKTGSLELLAPASKLLSGLRSARGVELVPELADDDGAQASRGAGGRRAVAVVGGKNEAGVSRSVRTLARAATTAFVDRGIWILYAGLGMVSWIDDQNGEPVESPLLLVPVKIALADVNSGPRLLATDDDPQINASLVAKLDRDFGLDLGGIDPDEPFAEIMAAAQGVLPRKAGWGVSDRAVVAPFTFHKEAMYRDLDRNRDQLLDHELIQLLALGPGSPAFDDVQFDPVGDDGLDETPPAEKQDTILDADGSQRRSILAALAGQSFVMDGPPGTGKSQTIANIIAQILGEGRSVLFVSEKAAALDVVRNRLTAANLDPFLLELHSHNVTRKAVAQSLGDALNEKPRASARFGQTKVSQLAAARRELTAYVQAMNEVRQPLDRSLHDVLGELGPLSDMRGYAPREFVKWRSLTSDQLAAIEAAASRLALAWQPVESSEDFLWRDVLAEDASASEVQELRGLAADALDTMEGVQEVTRSAATDLDLTIPATMAETGVLLDRLRLLEERPTATTENAQDQDRTLKMWLTRPAGDDVSAAVATLQTCHSAMAAARSELRQMADMPVPDQAVAARLQRCGRVADAATPAWSLPDDATSAQARRVMDLLETLTTWVWDVGEPANYLSERFGLDFDRVSVQRAMDLAGLAELASIPERPEPHWFNPGLQQQLDAAHNTLGQLVTSLNAHRAELTAVYTDQALGVPLDEIHQRVVANGGLGRFNKQARLDRKTLKSVSVRGKVDRRMIDLLPQAAAWQQADRALHEAEPYHAPVTGSYYQGPGTDFARLERALDAARRAVELARDELKPDLLAAQLGTASLPDPGVPMRGERLRAFSTFWSEHVGDVFGQDITASLARIPMRDLHTWLGEAASRLGPQLADWGALEAAAGRAFTAQEVRSVGALADAVHTGQAEFDRLQAAHGAILGCYAGATPELLTAAGNAHAWVASVQSHLHDRVPQDQAEALLHPSIKASEIEEAVTASDKATAELAARFSPSRAADLKAELVTFVAGSQLLQDMIHGADRQIPAWHELQSAYQAVADAGLSSTLDMLSRNRAPSADVPRAITYVVLSGWVACIQKDDDRVAAYHADLRDQQVHNFKELDQAFVRTRAAGIINAAAARRPRAIGGPAGLIQKQAQMKSRHLPIRDLLAKTKDIALVLKPCFMMSPLSVSQYLPPDIRFDVVIFDEASQVLPEDAANCIYRGRQLIVAGDQKQLPPTDFFRMAGADLQEEEEPDENDTDDFRSLLDLCKAQGLPSLPLTWHYRSRHEHLIAFSNYKFYEGKLNTFPGAVEQAHDLGVRSFLVDGVYRRGAQRDNPVEAATVVDRVLHHRRNTPDASIGVVAFSGAQESAVLGEIEARMVEHPELEALLNSEDRLEGFFVKSLENVQGDERDIIIFTVGYGPDEAGKFTANLGPLTREGGWKRLNVAITRARRRVEIVHSVRPEQFPPGVKEGVLQLRNYLDFAIQGPRSLAIDLKDSLGDAESPFEEDVLATIRAWGYDAVPQVGTAGYRLDIGVRDPQTPGRFMLAVECDGAAYHSAKAARDRDRLREQVLTGLGWKIHRIWGLSWYRDREGEKARLRTALETALHTSGAGLLPTQITRPAHDMQLTTESVDHLAMPDWATAFQPIRAHPVDASLQGSRGITSPAAKPALVDYLHRLVRDNQPVHVDLVRDAIRRDWGIGRVGPNIQAAINDAVVQLTRRHHEVTFKDNFFRLRNQNLDRVRVGIDGGTVRTVTQVPNEELDLAIVMAVRDAQTIGNDEAIAYVKGLFGWNRLGTDIEQALNASIRRLKRRGDVIAAGPDSLTTPR